MYQVNKNKKMDNGYFSLRKNLKPHFCILRSQTTQGWIAYAPWTTVTIPNHHTKSTAHVQGTVE